MTEPIEETEDLPLKTEDFSNHHMDSRNWDLVPPRDGDVIISTYAKAGTSWMQHIVRCLLEAPLDGPLEDICPWVDTRKNSKKLLISLADQSHPRRFFKTHLWQNFLPNTACYIYVARDGRDIAWSLHNFHRSFSPHVYPMLNAGEFEGPDFPVFDDNPLGPVAYFERWLSQDGYPFWGFFSHIRSWWKVRNHPRVLLVHYSNLKKDRAGEVARVFEFLRKFGSVRSGDHEDILRHAVESSSFESMKENGATTAPYGGLFLKEGSNAFFNKGVNSRWKDALPEPLSKKYEETAKRELGNECAHWLATGGM